MFTLMCVSVYLRFASARLSSAPPSCKDGMTRVATFDLNDTAWAACEDLERPGGALVLLSADGAAEWFEKTYEPYTQGGDDQYYLNLTKGHVMSAREDVLATTLLQNYSEITWALVESAVPPMMSLGIRCGKEGTGAEAIAL